MKHSLEDPMWDEFKPLWSDLLQIEESVLIAGGYGLFLKQEWLWVNQEKRTIIPISQWRDSTPRVTRDFDFIISLGIIANEETQKRVRHILDEHQFFTKESNRYWQFEKRMSSGATIVVDLHAPLPRVDYPGIEVRGRRIKSKPSLHESGIHGRTNAEAVGCEISPFGFELKNLEITVPNPITWCIMKLTAMNDHYDLSQSEKREEQKKPFSNQQALKHAQDVCRIVAMTTREESDQVENVLKAIADTEQFAVATSACRQFFQNEADWGARNVAREWEPEDLVQIRKILRDWFTL